MPWLQEGGSILETGAAIVHKGEYVVPAGVAQGGPSGVINCAVSIDVHATLEHGQSVEDWGKRLGASIANGVLSVTNGASQDVISRKTGAHILVPGTQVTTRTGRTPTSTTIIQPPVTTKSRFRAG